MSLYYNRTGRNTVRRRSGRARYDRATVAGILDEGLVGHVGLVSDNQPYVIPVLYAAAGKRIFIHGAPLSRLLQGLAEGIQICLTVTLLDGVVLARSAFHHSLNYRSVVVFGRGTEVREREAKREALRAVVEHVVPGRSHEVRGPSEQELDATVVVELRIEEASAKVRSGRPVDAPDDRSLPAWAGELPLRVCCGEPVPDAGCRVPLPAYAAGYNPSTRMQR